MYCDEPVVWKGALALAGLDKVTMSARRANGRPSLSLEALPDTLKMHGRIAPKAVWSYVGKLKYSTSKEILVAVLEPSSDDDMVAYIANFSYLDRLNRAVVVAAKSPAIRDAYVVPVRKGDSVPSSLAECGLSGPVSGDHGGRKN